MYENGNGSKYTDEIENSSGTWRVFLIMGRRSKFSVQQKLIIIKKTQTESIEEVTKVVYEINEISKRIDEKVAKYKIREEIVSINTEEE